MTASPLLLSSAFNSTRTAKGAYGLAAAIIVVDQITKAWIWFGLRLQERGHVELGPVFDLTFVLNRGVSFGFLTGGDFGRWMLCLFSVLVAAGLAWWVRGATRRLFAASMGLVIGGALGNVIDRIRLGGVIDFLNFENIHFPWVFNVADSAISIGVALLLLDSFISDRETQRHGKATVIGDSAGSE
ncbi:MAG TPA: signal peptidase II [Caulobacteraceae bacterium]|jgi:signal peptidase II